MTQISSTPSRKPTLAVLVVGTVAALGCAVGPAWLVRVGLAVALLTAFASVFMSWREMGRMVEQHLAEVRSLQEAHRDEMRAARTAHHAETMAIIERFNERKRGYQAELAQARAELAGLRTELAEVSLDAEAKQTRISALNKIVSDLEKQIAEADSHAQAATDEVLSLPRRGASHRSLVADLAQRPLVYPAEELRQA